MTNAQFYPEPVVGVARPLGRRGPMPNAQCPMPNAQRPMPNAQCPIIVIGHRLDARFHLELT
ncbi:MAG: hypothetical protein F6J93_18375 [Oscillatoria sp. SIO1A7]|nr:hypothetical protein [Oscillatoria sp. SIO1A7]